MTNWLRAGTPAANHHELRLNGNAAADVDPNQSFEIGRRLALRSLQPGVQLLQEVRPQEELRSRLVTFRSGRRFGSNAITT
jgi:hypothetical protein